MGDLAAVQRDERARASRGWDVCIVHDPQPAAICSLAPEKAEGWVWRCHIDVSTPNPATMERLLPYIRELPGVAVPRRRRTCRPGWTAECNIVPPAIDPLAPKNMALSLEDAEFVCEQFGIDIDRPMICQVSRFDPWKDPLGVIDAYRIVKAERPDVQLALVGSMASDDPEGWDFYNSTLAHAEGDPDIHILNNFNNVGAIEVNAFQSLADVVIQKSTREGFGLTVSEALWKGAAVHRRRRRRDPAAGRGRRLGLPRVARVEDCAARTLEILKDPALGKALGRRGKEHVRTHFLMPRYLRDYLRIFHEVLSAGRRSDAPLVLVSNRGPVTYQEDGSVKRGTGGLVTALTGLASHRDAVWIASAMTDGDVEVAERARRAAVRGRGAGRRRASTCASSSPTPRPTTASTTSSPTRCSGSSSTTSGT